MLLVCDVVEIYVQENSIERTLLTILTMPGTLIRINTVGLPTENHITCLVTKCHVHNVVFQLEYETKEIIQLQWV